LFGYIAIEKTVTDVIELVSWKLEINSKKDFVQRTTTHIT
jgi:hypothetical protein